MGPCRTVVRGDGGPTHLRGTAAGWSWASSSSTGAIASRRSTPDRRRSSRRAVPQIQTMIRAIRGRRRVSWSGIGQHDRQVTHGYDEQAAACPMGEGAWARCASSHPRRRPELAEGRGDPVATAAIRAALPGARFCCRGGSSLRAVAFPRSRRAPSSHRTLQARAVRRVYRTWQGLRMGQPVHLEAGHARGVRGPSLDEVLPRYQAWVLSQPELVARIKRELRAKRLGCWCAPKPCHGEILAAIANDEPLPYAG